MEKSFNDGILIKRRKIWGHSVFIANSVDEINDDSSNSSDKWRFRRFCFSYGTFYQSFKKLKIFAKVLRINSMLGFPQWWR